MIIEGYHKLMFQTSPTKLPDVLTPSMARRRGWAGHFHQKRSINREIADFSYISQHFRIFKSPSCVQGVFNRHNIMPIEIIIAD